MNKKDTYLSLVLIDTMLLFIVLWICLEAYFSRMLQL